jgi:hypothetical protein
MDLNTLTSTLNNNFQQIESENRTKIITDENGTRRVIMGRAPSGEYLIAVSAQGIDVLDALGK